MYKNNNTKRSQRLVAAIVIFTMLALTAFGLMTSLANILATLNVNAAGTTEIAAPQAVVTASTPGFVAADWIFDRANSVGQLNNVDEFRVTDLSGNANHLQLRRHGNPSFTPAQQFAFDDVSMTGNNGSMRFGGDFEGGFEGINSNDNWDLTRQDRLDAAAAGIGALANNVNRPRNGFGFVTVENAPINTNNFGAGNGNGFTMEFLYRMPADFTAPLDQNMGLITRTSNRSPDGRHINEYFVDGPIQNTAYAGAPRYFSHHVNDWVRTHGPNTAQNAPHGHVQLVNGNGFNWGREDGRNTVFIGSGRYSGWNSIRHSSLSLHVTNIREPEFHLFSEAGTEMSNAHWGLTFDVMDRWYSLVITVCFETDMIRSYVNNGHSFRNRYMGQWGGVNAGRGGENFTGLFTDLDDPRFEIGTGLRSIGEPVNAGTAAAPVLAGREFTAELVASQFLRGSIERVRISEGVLETPDWIVPNASIYTGPLGVNDSFEVGEGNYTLALIPDTQNTIRWTPHVSYRASQYLIQNRDRFNMMGIMHLGDITQYNTDREWVDAQAAFWPLAYHFNYLSMRGNHDGNPARHNRFFGPHANFYGAGFHTHPVTGANFNSGASLQLATEHPFAGKIYYDLVRGRANFRRSGYNNAFVTNSDSHYMIVRGGSFNYLLINMGYVNQGGNQAAAELAWLNEVLTRYPTYPAVITSHHIFIASANAADEAVLSGPGPSIWNVARQHNNVFLMVGAHNHASGRTPDDLLINDDGNAVIGMLVNYQMGFNGGNAWYRFLEFDENNGYIHYSTYSPYAASLTDEERATNPTWNVNFLTGTGNYGTIPFDFSERFDFATSYDEIVVETIEAIAQLWTYRNRLAIGAIPLLREIRSTINEMTAEQRAQVFNLRVFARLEHEFAHAPNSWHSGTASPPLTQGRIGDLFLNTTTGNVYTRELLAWTITSNVIGEQGQQGQQGTQGNPGAQGTPGNAGTDGSGCGASAITAGSIALFIFLALLLIAAITLKPKQKDVPQTLPQQVTKQLY